MQEWRKKMRNALFLICHTCFAGVLSNCYACCIPGMALHSFQLVMCDMLQEWFLAVHNLLHGLQECYQLVRCAAGVLSACNVTCAAGVLSAC